MNSMISRQTVSDNINPKAKVLALISLAVISVSTKPLDFAPFIGFYILIFALFIFLQIDMGLFCSRTVKILPFIFFIGIFIPFIGYSESGGVISATGEFGFTSTGLELYLYMVLKSSTALFFLLLLTLSTPFENILKALENLGLPKVFVASLGMTFRYLSLISSEAEKMKRAVLCRGFEGKSLLQIKIIGNLIASLLLRSFERGERVYKAMVSRGFEGTFPASEFKEMKQSDYLFIILLVTSALFSRFIS